MKSFAEKAKIPEHNRSFQREGGSCRKSPIIAVVTLQTFYLGKHDLLTVYLGKLDFSSVTDFSLGIYLGEILSSGSWICLQNNRVSLNSYPKAIARENEIPRLLANRRSSAKVLMTEPDIDHAVKEILGARVVYVFAFLHLAR